MLNTTKCSNTSVRHIAAAFVLSVALLMPAIGDAIAKGSGDRTSNFKKPNDYSQSRDWHLKAENLVPYGTNNYYFPLKPGHKFIMEKPDHPDGPFRKEVIVLDETEPFDLPGIGKFKAAIVREDEFFEGKWTQRALNWFVFDKSTQSVYSLGELSWEIDDEGNKVFEGTWRSGELDGGGVADVGMLMPGVFNLGARYIYDGSESESIGGSENQERGITIKTPAGTFKNCVRVREQNITDLSDITDKVWCPGIGLAMDTSDGLLVASDAVPGTDTSSFGKFHLSKNKPQFAPPVAKITGHQATEIALKTISGKATSVSIERKRRRNVYVIEIQEKGSGQEVDVFVDIETGKVIGTDR